MKQWTYVNPLKINRQNVYEMKKLLQAKLGKVVVPQFLCKNTSISAFSGRILERSALMVSPAVENTLSEGIDDAWAHKYVCATLCRSGKVSLFCHHHRTGSEDMGTAGRPLYIFISKSTCSPMFWVTSCGVTCSMSCSSPNSSSRAVLGHFTGTVHGLNWLLLIYHMVIIINCTYMAFLHILLSLSLALRVVWHWYLMYKHTV